LPDLDDFLSSLMGLGEKVGINPKSTSIGGFQVPSAIDNVPPGSAVGPPGGIFTAINRNVRDSATGVGNLAEQARQEQELRDQQATEKAGLSNVGARIFAKGADPVSGSADEIVAELDQRAVQRYQALLSWEASFGGIAVRGDSVPGGSPTVMYELKGLNPETGDYNYLPHAEGSKLLQAYLAAEDQLVNFANTAQLRGIDIKTGGASGSGGGQAAFDFIGAEQARVSEAERQFDDYINRITQVAGLEATEGTKARLFAEGLNQGLQQEAERNAQIKAGNLTVGSSSVSVRPGGPPNTDLTQFANQIKATLPGQAPASAQINPAVFQPPPSVAGVPATNPTLQFPHNLPPPPDGLIPSGSPDQFQGTQDTSRTVPNVVQKVSQFIDPTQLPFLSFSDLINSKGRGVG
jgi:hypothetical protein